MISQNNFLKYKQYRTALSLEMAACKKKCLTIQKDLIANGRL